MNQSMQSNRNIDSAPEDVYFKNLTQYVYNILGRSGSEGEYSIGQ